MTTLLIVYAVVVGIATFINMMTYINPSGCNDDFWKWEAAALLWPFFIGSHLKAGFIRLFQEMGEK